MTGQNFWFLENIDITELLSENKLQEAISQYSRKTFKKGEYVYLPDHNAENLYFILEGEIKIGSIGDGKEITKAILSKGEVFGELSITANDQKRQDFAYATENSKICAISASEMKSMMKKHSSLSLFFMKMMGSKVLDLENRLESLVFKDSRSRIIEYLTDLVEKKGQRVGYEWVVRNFTTHQEIANYTATSRQTVTTVLNELRDKDQLTFNRKRLLVRDLERLKKEIKSE